MEWLIASVVVLAGYGAAIYFKKAKLPAFLTHLPIGSAPEHLTLADQVAQGGTARGAALALYGYLKVHGADQSPAFANLVIAFQSMNNSDPNAVTLTGPLQPNGIFDRNTSAALTIYTHDPIPPATPPAPSPPPPPSVVMNASIPGAAAVSGFNLFTYLKAHGNDRSPALQKLVQQFQLDVNTDPKFAGPANGTGLPTIIKTRLQETGMYDVPTANALAVETPERINP